jgi:cytochrome c oxidase subunit 3
VKGDPWPAPGTDIPVLVAAVNTAVLVSSSFTMHWATVSAKNGNRQAMRAGLFATFFLGLTFLSVQINEYIHLGWSPQNHAQGTIFYGLTGLHGAHVTVGLMLLSMVTIRSFRGHYSAEAHRGMEVPGIYWHFVDVMWIIVFLTVYII